MAIHYYGATEAEKQELEAAVLEDEKADLTHDHIHVDAKGGIAETFVEEKV